MLEIIKGWVRLWMGWGGGEHFDATTGGKHLLQIIRDWLTRVGGRKSLMWYKDRETSRKKVSSAGN